MKIKISKRHKGIERNDEGASLNYTADRHTTSIIHKHTHIYIYIYIYIGIGKKAISHYKFVMNIDSRTGPSLPSQSDKTNI